MKFTPKDFQDTINKLADAAAGLSAGFRVMDHGECVEIFAHERCKECGQYRRGHRTRIYRFEAGWEKVTPYDLALFMRRINEHIYDLEREQ